MCFMYMSLSATMYASHVIVYVYMYACVSVRLIGVLYSLIKFDFDKNNGLLSCLYMST